MSEGNHTVQTVSPEKLITGITDTLRKDKGLDLELLEILASMVLKVSPTQTAVADAATDIEALALKRARGGEDGSADQD